MAECTKIAHNGDNQKKLSAEAIVKNPIIWPLILLIEVFIYSSYGLLINLSSKNGQVTFQSSSLILNVESVKLLISLLMTVPEISRSGVPSFQLKYILPFSVPAILYCFNNNIAVYMQEEMDPATFQVLCNLKIVSTAILYRLIIKRRLNTYQWLSLVILTFAGGLNGCYGLMAKSTSLQEIHVSVMGLAMTVLYCLVSGFAGVYTEYILKKNAKIPLPFQNCFLYTFGIVLNFLAWLIQSDGAGNLFQGYSGFTWLAVLAQALNGLMMSLIMKYSSNIIRLFIISSSIPIATILSMLVFNLNPGFTFVVVIFLVILAIYMYNHPSKA